MQKEKLEIEFKIFRVFFHKNTSQNALKRVHLCQKSISKS